MAPDDEPDVVRHSMQQTIRVEAGTAYGAIGADIHVFGNGTPVYLLFRHRATPTPASHWLTAQPSRMLDARAEVVAFTGREQDLAALIAWRDGPPKLAVRWLHGPGGQGKTRLARHFAARSEAAGWLVADAVQGTDAHPPTEDTQDLRIRDATGVLLLVDYADRWPVSYLSWLFQNRLLRQRIPVRVLLLARSTQTWPAVRGKLAKGRSGVETSTHALADLPPDDGARAALFTAARDDFAAHYPAIHLAAVRVLAPPPSLSHPDFGQALAVQMAALAAVDNRSTGAQAAPTDVLGLTIHLLDREHENWRQLYENEAAGLDFTTPDQTMSRLVFTAVLTGPQYPAGAADLVRRVLPDVPVDRALADHGRCYPATDPDRANLLEPLLPDRLAEDFLALTLTGHDHPDYQPDPWSTNIPELLFAPDHRAPHPPHAPRLLTYLNAAAERWPHLLGTLETLHDRLPRDEHLTLDLPAAAVTRRLAEHVLATTTDPMTLADWNRRLGIACLRSGQAQEGVRALKNAVALLRDVLGEDPEDGGELAGALISLGYALFEADRLDEAIDATEEAVAILRPLSRALGKHRELRVLAPAVDNLGTFLSLAGRAREALAATREGVDIRRRLAAAPGFQVIEIGRLRKASINMDTVNLGDVPPHLAKSLDNLGVRLGDLGLFPDAVLPAAEALEIRRGLTEEDPDTHLPWLANSLHNTALWLLRIGVLDEARALIEEAVTVRRRLTTVNPLVYRAELERTEALRDEIEAARRVRPAGARTRGARPVPDRPAALLPTLAALRADGFRHTEELQALETHRRALAYARARGDRAAEAALLGDVGSLYRRLGRSEEAVAACREAVDVFRALGDPGALASARGNLGSALRDAGRPTEAIRILRGAADRHRALGDAGNNGIALANLARALLDADRPQEGEAAARQAVECYRAIDDRHRESEALIVLSDALHDQGRYEEALDTDERNAELCDELHDRNGRAQVFARGARTLWAQGEKAEAAAVYETAADLYEESGDEAESAEALFKAAMVRADLGQTAQAVTYLQEVAETFARLGEPRRRADSLVALGRVLRSAGQLIGAQEALRQAVDICRELGERTGEGHTLAELGVVQQQDHLYEAAVGSSREALRLCREEGYQEGERIALSTLALALRHLGEYEEALRTHRAGTALCRAVGSPEQVAGELNNLGTTLRETGAYGEAAQVLAEAMELYRAVGNTERLRVTRYNLGLTRRGRRGVNAAADRLRAAYARRLGARARGHLAKGRHERALHAQRGCCHYWRKLGDRHREGLAVLDLSSTLLALGKYAEAESASDYAAQIFRYSGHTALERTARSHHTRACEAATAAPE
ncbi:tetratricopeptide repeat protein [Streptomyces sp. NPDC046237]|uniref:tetratricopeptide repeat protein n=1 Tax=Streptomyces sp. NPDC046237 TaxID=3154914 RepID=UPI0033C9BE56